MPTAATGAAIATGSRVTTARSSRGAARGLAVTSTTIRQGALTLAASTGSSSGAAATVGAIAIGSPATTARTRNGAAPGLAATTTTTQQVAPGPPCLRTSRSSSRARLLSRTRREASALDLRITVGALGTGTTTGAATTRARSATPTLILASGCAVSAGATSARVGP